MTITILILVGMMLILAPFFENEIGDLSDMLSDAGHNLARAFRVTKDDGEFDSIIAELDAAQKEER